MKGVTNQKIPAKIVVAQCVKNCDAYKLNAIKRASAIAAKAVFEWASKARVDSRPLV